MHVFLLILKAWTHVYLSCKLLKDTFYIYWQSFNFIIMSIGHANLKLMVFAGRENYGLLVVDNKILFSLSFVVVWTWSRNEVKVLIAMFWRVRHRLREITHQFQLHQIEPNSTLSKFVIRLYIVTKSNQTLVGISHDSNHLSFWN